MTLSLLGLSFAIILFLAYNTYGRFLNRQLFIDPHRQTPAHSSYDGRDFIPTSRFYLFPQHFSAISAAGPIAGPIMACLMWGYLPCLLWILLGVVLIGAVHDYLSLVVSVRNGATSIADIAKKTLGSKAGYAMMGFIWLSLIYVIIAFTDITARSFVGVTEELDHSFVKFNPGGAVAASAMMYLLVSICFGLVERYLKPKIIVSTLIFVPLTFLCVYLGTTMSTLIVLDVKMWCLLIVGYCFAASLLPVWLLLQPRGYLGGFILYSAIAIGAYGMFFGGFDIKQAAFKSFDHGGPTGSLFPFLFVTIACGAVSGFHGLVCSGTTAKQIDKETHMQSIGYGAMLCEALVALLALATVMIFADEEIANLRPGTIYGKGIGEFLSLIVGKEHLHLAITFGAMAFSTFVFDTLDVATRLGRYLLQEVLGLKRKGTAIIATALTMVLPLIILTYADDGLYLAFWSLFGASNQLLAALSLLVITIWLYEARQRLAFALIPMLFVLVTTCYALGGLALENIKATSVITQFSGLIAVALLILATYFVVAALAKLRKREKLTSKVVLME